jgi:hypothetical protein
LRLVAAAPIGTADLTKGQKVAAIKAAKAGLLATDTRGALALTDAGRKRLGEDSAPPSKRRATAGAEKPANGNGRIASSPRPAAAPVKADDTYREQLAASLEREALLAGMYARELRRRA